MNPFMYPQLPYAMSGAGAWLSPEMQGMQPGPYSSTGTTVPQNTWTGSQFNIAAPKPVETSAPVPAAPPTGITTPGKKPVWTAEMFAPATTGSPEFAPYGSASYPVPQGPAPGGFDWNSRLGYWQPAYLNQQENDDQGD